MKKVGEILSAARKEKGWTVEELSKRIKIQERFVLALEASDFSKLPQAPFAKGFIRVTSIELGLKPEAMIAIFRRDFGVNKQGNIVPRSLVETEEKRLRWSPLATTVMCIAIVATTFGLYLLFQLRLLVSAPTLIVDSPKDKSIVSTQIVVDGRTDPSATITINGQTIKKNKNGTFSQILQLPEGTHTIIISSAGQNKKETRIERTVEVKQE